jgi:hypothetical protein
MSQRDKPMQRCILVAATEQEKDSGLRRAARAMPAPCATGRLP